MKALVLAGGGSKGAWQLGVLKKRMGERGQDYQIITGVSVGALNAAGLSQIPYGKPKEAIDWLLDLWSTRLETKNIYKRWFPFGRAHALWKKSVYDSQPLIDLVNNNIDRNKVLLSGRQVAVGAVCLNDGEHRFVREFDVEFINWVLASASFPVFLKPIEIDGKLWSDGGIKNVTPLSQAIKMGATEIDILIPSDIWSHDVWTSERKRAVPDQIVRTLSLMNDKIMQDDIQLTRLKNDMSKYDNRFRHVKINVTVPNGHLIEDSLNFDPLEIKRMIDLGYADADNVVSYG